MVHQIYLGLEEDESFGYVETIDNHLLQSNPAKKKNQIRVWVKNVLSISLSSCMRSQMKIV